LDDLRKRVSDLTSTIECMNKTFEDCRDRLISIGLSENQLHDLSETTVRFAGFVKTVRRPSDSTDEVVAESKTPPTLQSVVDITSPARQTDHLPLPSVKNVPSWIDQAALTHTERPSQRSDIGMGYTMYMPNHFDQMLENFSVPALAQALRSPSQNSPLTLPFDLNAPNLLHQEPPTLSLSPSAELPPPKTYSFQEKTLARRLHRACLEAAYHLLLDPSRRPQTFERVFKLSLLSRDRVRMAASIKRILDRSLDEPLDFWDAPKLHIGGAGTHYPDRQRQRGGGYPLRDRAKFHLGVVGPQMLNLLENVVQSRPAAEVSVEIEGFEGEWFDPYDIEGYLESRGIFIDPTVSFVEAQIENCAAHAGDAVQHQYSPGGSSTTLSSLSTRSSSGGGGGYNYLFSTTPNNPAASSTSGSSSINSHTTTATTTTNPTPSSTSHNNNNNNNNNNNTATPPWPAPASDPEQWSALQLLEPDLERWREVEDTSVVPVVTAMQNNDIGGLALGNVGFSDADTGSWMNFFDSPDQYQNQDGQAAAIIGGLYGTGSSGSAVGAGGGADGNEGYGQATMRANYNDTSSGTIPSPPLSSKKAVIIDVAKFVKGKHSPFTE